MPITFDQLPQEVSNINSRLDRIEKLLNWDPRKTEEEDELFGVPGASKFLGLTDPTIYSKVSRREIPFMKKNGRLYFSRKELVDYLKTGRVKTRLESLDEAHLHLKSKKERGR